MPRRLRTLVRSHLIVAACLALARDTVRAQQDSARAAPLNARWVLSVFLGATSGGPSPDADAAMRAGGYTTSFGGCSIFGCVPESPSPASYTHANPILISVRGPLRPARLGLEFFVDQGSKWSTEGRRADRVVRMDYGGTFGAATVTLNAPRVRVGVGPMFLRGWWHYLDTSNGDHDEQKFTRVGLLGSAGVSVPMGPRVILEGIAQYRAFPATRVRSSSIAPDMSSFDAKFSHAYLAAGVGLRL